MISFEADDPQAAVEQLIGLGLEEFFAAVFLHQETIRDFITTTPEKRSATIDRMLGTYLLRTLVKVVDPKVPAKAIEEAEEAIERLDRQLSQASVISREVIQKRKEDYGDPAELPLIFPRLGGYQDKRNHGIIPQSEGTYDKGKKEVHPRVQDGSSPTAGDKRQECRTT
jgi:hypothetical protein